MGACEEETGTSGLMSSRCGPQPHQLVTSLSDLSSRRFRLFFSDDETTALVLLARNTRLIIIMFDAYKDTSPTSFRLFLLLSVDPFSSL